MKTTLTPIGKQLRILRIERGELLYDMAENLQLSSSYISAIENGKRKASKKFLESLKEFYSLTTEEFRKIEDAVAESVDSVSLDIANVTIEKKEFALAFAKKFDELDAETIRQLNKLIRR